MRLPDKQEGGGGIHINNREKGNRFEKSVDEDLARDQSEGRVYIDGWSIKTYSDRKDSPALCVACAKNETCDHDPKGKGCSDEVGASKNTARLITTFKCIRSCSYCMNTADNGWIIKNHGNPLIHIDQLLEFDEVCITGGEPLTNPEQVLQIVEYLRCHKPSIKIYLYTTMYNEMLAWEILPLIDGVHYTLHAPFSSLDQQRFAKFQLVAKEFPKKSFRLMISQEIDTAIPPIIPKVWSRIESKPWLLDCELPKHETLFLMEEYP